MRLIVKAPEPQSLTTHRSRPHGDYDNFPDKEALRRALATEQRGLCCYCMSRIRPDRAFMKIEHWRCRVRNRAEELSYRNLLGACLGGEGRPPPLQHCDTGKRDRDIRWNPADPAHRIERRVRYELDGSIRAEDADFDDQINDVLNLNLPLLKRNRKGILDAVLEWWKSEKARVGGPVPRHILARKREWQLAGDGELKPYCQVAVWWLEGKLMKTPS